ncbi:MAG: hypothetical protein CSA62_10785 [Planctomycetota bacterium]|nr:MAG: hypothetical protein CSA62_10785 [Planctomycetota bacterium]
MAPKTHRSRRTLGLASLAAALLFAPISLGQERGRLERGQPEASLAAPSLVHWAIQDHALKLALPQKIPASEALLKRARQLLASKNPQIRQEALLLLGHSKDPGDRARIVDSVQKQKDQDLRERAIFALGLKGDTIAQFQLGRILESRDESGRSKALAALACGLSKDGRPISSEITVYAQELLRLGMRSHADELAGTLFGFSKDAGREFLSSFLKGRSSGGAAKEASSRKGKASPTEPQVLRSVLLASLGRIAATQGETRILLTELNNKRQPALLAFRIAWGLLQNDGKALDKRERERLVAALNKRMRLREPELAGICLLAITRLDRKLGLATARKELKARNKRPMLLPASLLTLGRLGTSKDLNLLYESYESLPDQDSRAAWCLAISESHRRLAPAEWPLASGLAPEAELPQPLPTLRSLAAGAKGKPSSLQLAAAIALAELQDKHSINLLMDLASVTRQAGLRRQLGIAIVALQAPTLSVSSEELHIESIEWSVLDTLAAGGHPSLWKSILSYLDHKALPANAKTRLLRLANVAASGPGTRLQERLDKRFGPGPMPRLLQEVAGWQELPAPR